MLYINTDFRLLFDATGIFVEEQLWYNLIHSLGDGGGFDVFPKGNLSESEHNRATGV